MTSLARLLQEETEDDRRGPALSTVFEEEPVPLSVFVRDKKFLHNPALSDVQYEAVRYIERIYYPDLYSQMAEEFNEPYWADPLRMVNFITLQWAKGSLSPNVRIYNSRTGQWVKLRDWREADQVAAADKDSGAVFASEGSPSFREGFGSMFRVKTSKGFEIDVWEGHRFLTWGKRRYAGGQRGRLASWTEARKYGTSWERLWDMEVGDPIAVPQSVPEPLEAVSQPTHEVELAGLLLGNGTVSGGQHGNFTCGEQSPLTRARARELFEVFEDTEVDEHADHSDGSTRWRVNPKLVGTRNHSPSVRRFTERVGLDGCNAFDKHVPEEYFSLPTRQVALLLSRLIDTDGWVSFSNTPEVGYSTVSHQLAVDVQRLFLRLGVLASLDDMKTTCQNCGSIHEGPHNSYQVRVRDRHGLETVAQQLTLLDKDPMRLRLLDWCAERRGRKQRATHGDLVWDRIESIEYLGEDEYWTLTVDGPSSYIGNGVVHHNSGKDHIVRIASMRIAYLVLCLKSPQAYYGMPEQDTIHMLNVASTSSQAQNAFFLPMTRAVKRGWFSNRAEPRFGERQRNRAEARMNSILYDKNVEAVSGHSDAESQEGLNLLLGVADELDAFKTKAEFMQYRPKQIREPTKSAEGILKMLRTSASTRFPKVYKIVRISYPRYQGSMIQILTEQARKDVEKNPKDSRHFVSGPMCTWEVNPRVKGKEDFKEDYEEDEAMAEAMYECRPRKSTDAYFRNMEAVQSCISEEDQPLEVEYELERVTSTQTGRSADVWMARWKFDESFVPIEGARYVIHGDMAKNGDRAGVAMSHVSAETEVTEQVVDAEGAMYARTITKPVVKNDFTIALDHDLSKDPAREIQLFWVRDLIFELIRRGFTLVRATFDGWQSVDSMQLLNQHGVETDLVSTDRNQGIWKNVRDLAYEARLEMPVNLDLITEIQSLGSYNGKIDHQPGGAKDLADAWACSISVAILEGGIEDPEGHQAYAGTIDFGDPTPEPLFGLEGYEDMNPMALPIGLG